MARDFLAAAHPSHQWNDGGGGERIADRNALGVLHFACINARVIPDS